MSDDDEYIDVKDIEVHRKRQVRRNRYAGFKAGVGKVLGGARRVTAKTGGAIVRGGSAVKRVATSPRAKKVFDWAGNVGERANKMNRSQHNEPMFMDPFNAPKRKKGKGRSENNPFW